MSPSYADTTDKLAEDVYFYLDFNMRMKLARKGLLPQVTQLEFDQVSDCSTAEWKSMLLKGHCVITGDHFNKKTPKEGLLVTKQLHSLKMKPGSKFAVHVNIFKELGQQMESIGESLDETRQLVLLLGNLTDE
ncbi:hypothetical protein F444_10455 [Phytophthora nicotianae P1976]|uniref:Uncharacterized protein n=1 Tax=Phytophthora nicotianae P1976 TaxID=1317066 RepID=A0A081A3Z7_PHYNI|nr:hypothetical protein F444_10455 [Phytophthora nicotianae P1976]